MAGTDVKQVATATTALHDLPYGVLSGTQHPRAAR